LQKAAPEAAPLQSPSPDASFRLSLRAANVQLSLQLLVLLVLASPAVVFVDNAMTWGLITMLTAAAIGLIGSQIRPAEADYVSTLLRPVVIVLAAPAIWMLVQALATPFDGLMHPIWASAAAALGAPMLGRMSIDPGATFLSIGRYLCATGILVATAAATVDRRRAEWMLFALVGAAGLTALIYFSYTIGSFSGSDTAYDIGRTSAMSAISVLGAIVTAAAAIRAFERFETRRSTRPMTHRQFWSGFALWLAAWSVSWFVISGRSSHIFAAACGTASLATIEVIRRLRIDRRASAAIAAVAIAIAIAVVAIQPAEQNDVTLRFASAPSSGVSMAQQMIADTRWSGVGAGAFPSLVPIYRDINDPEVLSAPTTASAIAIETGRPALVLVLLSAVAAAALLAIGAIRRGRDSFYPAAGASCVIALSVEMFTDASALSSSVQIIAAAAIGLGLAQSKSRGAASTNG
jgi:hypothetical protein